MDIRPIDLPVVRAELLNWASTWDSSSITAYANATSPGVPRSAAAHLGKNFEGSVRTLRAADLFHVSAEMGSLAEAAATSLPEFTLAAEDLPTPSGLVVFETSVQVPTDAGALPVRAAFWGEAKPGLLAIHWCADTSLVAPTFGVDARASVTRVAPFHGMSVTLSNEPIRTSLGWTGDCAAIRTAERYFLQVLKSIWLLMGQTIVSAQDAHYDRASARRLKRANLDLDRVRVITLRRPRGSSGESSDSGREYHHQWIVRGHWRQQWYATRQVHRPVWIAPHIKGPEGAPVLGGEKVHALKH